MPESEIERRFDALGSNKKSENYNFRHFKTKILLNDARRTVEAPGFAPGEIAPNFESPPICGDSVQLSNLRERPAILHSGSYN